VHPQPVSIVGRVALAAAVLGLAAAVYFVWAPERGSVRRGRTTGAPAVLRGLTGSRGEDWYRENVARWQALEFVPLSDLEELARTIRNVVQGRHPGPEVDPEVLARDLTAFFYALGAPDPDEYLARLRPYRRLKTAAELAETTQLYGPYRALSGRELSADVSPPAVLGLFWNAKGAAGRAAKVSTRGFIQVAYSRPIPDAVAPGSVLASIVCPLYSMYEQAEPRSWLGPFSVGFPRLTVPLADFDATLTRHGRLMMCDALFAIRTDNDQTFPLDVTFFYSPEQNHWYYVLAGAGFPYELFWPL